MNYISKWLKEYAVKANKTGFAVGVSGGVDSALTSTLCAETGLKTHCVMMPIYSNTVHVNRAYCHVEWLEKKFFDSIHYVNISLADTYEHIVRALPSNISELALANTKSRLRMVALYAYATTNNLLVAGTGNKIEDYGVGFFTKYGDGGVDLSPIGELTKTEVWNMAKELGINQEIIDAKPSDDLWIDSRTDESQIGASYEELEWAMHFWDNISGDFCLAYLSGNFMDKQKNILEVYLDLYNSNKCQANFCLVSLVNNLTDRQKEVLQIYLKFHNANKHKMEMPPVCPKP